jgi:hypothetical protein
LYITERLVVNCISVSFQVLTVASMKCRVLWNVAPCSHVKVHRRFIDLMTEVVRTSETSVASNVTTSQKTLHLCNKCV